MKPRTREIGIPVALGAQRGAALRLAFQDAAIMVGIGVFMGIASAFAATCLVQSFLHRVGKQDPYIAAIATLLLAAAAGMAT